LVNIVISGSSYSLLLQTSIKTHCLFCVVKWCWHCKPSLIQSCLFCLSTFSLRMNCCLFYHSYFNFLHSISLLCINTCETLICHLYNQTLKSMFYSIFHITTFIRGYMIFLRHKLWTVSKERKSTRGKILWEHKNMIFVMVFACIYNTKWWFRILS
jgi:hypothetical protein